MSIIPISSNPLISLSAEYPYDGIFDLKAEYYEHSDSGFYGYSNPLLEGIKDVKIINDSLFFISSAVNIGSVIDDFEDTTDVRDMVIYSGLKRNTSTYFAVTGDYIDGNETNADNRSLFRFIKLDDGTYNVLDINGKYWTIDVNSPWDISLEDQFVDDTENQQTFTLEYSGSYVYIKTNFKNPNYPTFEPEYYQRYVAVSEATGRVGATGFVVDDPAELLYELVDFDVDAFERGYTPDSVFVKYSNELENPGDNKNLEFSSITRGVKNNLLVDSPYKTAIDKDSKKIEVNIANLKNIQTPEYEYTEAPFLAGASTIVNQIKRREYNKLFMGSNQDRGYQNPFLGFNADTKALTFGTDSVTYFHYPKTAPANIPIQTVGFTKSGAVPGNTPARADKIWKKLADYEKHIWWGNSTHSAVTPTSSVYGPVQQGTWLCSWLSGNNIGSVSGQWMDRWYYPGFATVSNAMTFETLFVPNTGDVVWDEPSQMTLDGGCWYKYFHFGNEENDKIVTALSNNGLTALKLDLEPVTGANVQDRSIYNNDGEIHNFTSSVAANEVFNFNGNDQYCLVPYTSSFKPIDKLSVVTNMKFEDWDNVQGNHIISNGVNNGWNIQATNGYFNPILTVFERTYGHILFLNNDGDMYYDALYPISGSTYGDPTAIAMDGDITIWATNNETDTKRLYKANIDGILTTELAFGSSVNLTDLTIDQEKNIWVLDTSTNTASGFSTSLDLLSTIEMTSISAVNRIDFDTENVFLSGDYTILDRCIDEDNNVFELRLGESNIYKNETIVYSSSGVTNIGCDSDGILWVLKNGNQLVKTAANSVDEDSTCIVGTSSGGQHSIVFTNEYSIDQYKDFVWVLHSSDNKLFKVSNECIVLKEINLSDYVDIISTKFVGQDRANMVFGINGDCTAFEWQTKYNSHTPRIEANIVLNEALTGGVSLSYPASNFVNDEYYNIAFTYDSYNSDAKLYVNTTLVDSTSSTTSSEIYYKVENSMLIGANMGTGSSLNSELGVNEYAIVGNVNGLRIYNYILNRFDIKHIELLNYDFHDMVWNMPVGDQSFVEEIERFFKHKLPGMKSQYYNIKLAHLNITDPSTRAIIEGIIRDTVKRVAPAYTELYKIIWE